MRQLVQACVVAIRFVIAAATVFMLSQASLPAAAQAIGHAEVASLRDNAAVLPDAPMPAESDSFAIAQLLDPDGQQAEQPSQSRQSLPKPDGQNQPAPPSLGDLGLSPSQTKPDPDLQARLDRHTRMLRIHQRLGLITLAPLAGACISSAFAPPDLKKGKDNATGRDIHVGLGAASVTMYAFTASYAIRAPRVSDEPARGGIKLHKYLIWVHGPGMILTPILGAMAYDQANNGEKVHGIASAHAAVAWTTVAAYGAAIVAVSWPIHIGSLKL
jgi:hypothetical protein